MAIYILLVEFDPLVVEVITPNTASSQSTLNGNTNTMGMVSLVTSAAIILTAQQLTKQQKHQIQQILERGPLENLKPKE